jgi:hypothetical protein
MKNLITFELYKSTYMNAAKKLEPRHKKRAEELRKHAAEQGMSAFMGVKGFNRIYHHPFVFENYNDYKYVENLKGKFFITDYNEIGGYRPGFKGINVIMKSDYHVTINMEIVAGPEKYVRLDLEFAVGGKTTNFHFNNRKDAIEFRKFVLEIAHDEIVNGDLYFNLESIPINELYES